jgi:transposase
LSGEEGGQLTSKNLDRGYYTRFDRLAQLVAASSAYHPAAVRADRRDLAVMLAGPVTDMAFEEEAMLLHRKRCADRTVLRSGLRSDDLPVLGDRFLRSFDPTFEPNGVIGVRRLEVITGVGGRRSWSHEDKARIIAESYDAGETVCAVARRHGLTPQQLFAWRRLAQRSGSVLPPMFVPAVLETIQPEPPVAAIPPRRARRRSRTAGIELEIAGVEARVGADAKPRAIEAVIRALKASS